MRFWAFCSKAKPSFRASGFFSWAFHGFLIWWDYMTLPHGIAGIAAAHAGSEPQVENFVPKFADFVRNGPIFEPCPFRSMTGSWQSMAIHGNPWHDGRLHTLHGGVLAGQNHPHQHPGPLLGLKRLTAHFVMRHLPHPKPKAVDVDAKWCKNRAMQMHGEGVRVSTWILPGTPWNPQSGTSSFPIFSRARRSLGDFFGLGATGRTELGLDLVDSPYMTLK